MTDEKAELIPYLCCKDAAAAKTNAETIVSDLQKFVTLFPESSKNGPPETWAKPEIWSDMDGFKTAADTAMKAATAVAARSRAQRRKRNS